MTGALLFDLDGTIVDSDAQHMKAFQSVFALHGVDLDHKRYVESILGAQNEAIGAEFLSHLSPEERKQALELKEATYRDNLGHIDPIEGFAELLDYADFKGLERALVTNAPRANAERVLEALGMRERIAIQVTGDDVARGKPDPTPYVTALRLTGAQARRSVAFEDSLSGLRSALGAGLAVIALTTTLRASTLLAAGATLAVADFTDPRILPLIESRIAD